MHNLNNEISFDEIRSKVVLVMAYGGTVQVQDARFEILVLLIMEHLVLRVIKYTRFTGHT
jgi:hypothetical protein